MSKKTELKIIFIAVVFSVLILPVKTATAADFDFSVSVNPDSISVTQGRDTSTVLTATLLSGTAQPVSFSCVDPPLGVSCSFSPIFCEPPCISKERVTISTTRDAPTGAHSITMRGTGGGLTRDGTFSLTVRAPAAFDFSVSVNPANGITMRGLDIQTTLTATLISGTARSVSFSCGSPPAGVSCTFSPLSCDPPCTSTVTISTTGATPLGPHSITIRGTGAGLTREAIYSLTVTDPHFDFFLSVDPATGTVTQGASINTTLRAELLFGTTQSVSFSCGSPPAGVSCTFSPLSCDPPCTSTVTISTTGATPLGIRSVIIGGTGADGTRIKAISYVLTVTAPTAHPAPGIPGLITFPNPLGARTFEELINALVNFVFWVTIVLAPLMIIISGFYFVTALGDPKKIETGKNIIVWTVVAVIVVLLARGLIALLRGILGAP